MANRNSPFGLVPVKKLDGSAYNGEVHPYLIPSSDSTNRFIGDPFDIEGSSNSSDVNGFKAGTLPTIAIATAGATYRTLGVLHSVYRPTSTTDDLSKKYRVASEDTVVFIALANNTVFEIQNDEDMVAGDIGGNANLVAGSGGSTTSGISSWQLDSSSIGNDATYQCTIIRLANREDNALGDYAIAEVMLNLPRLSPDTVGI